MASKNGAGQELSRKKGAGQQTKKTQLKKNSSGRLRRWAFFFDFAQNDKQIAKSEQNDQNDSIPLMTLTPHDKNWIKKP